MLNGEQLRKTPDAVLRPSHTHVCISAYTSTVTPPKISKQGKEIQVKMSRTRLLWAFVPGTTGIHIRGGKCGQRYRLKKTVWKTDKQQMPHADKGRLTKTATNTRSRRKEGSKF